MDGTAPTAEHKPQTDVDATLLISHPPGSALRSPALGEWVGVGVYLKKCLILHCPLLPRKVLACGHSFVRGNPWDSQRSVGTISQHIGCSDLLNDNSITIEREELHQKKKKEEEGGGGAEEEKDEEEEEEEENPNN